VGTAAVLTTKEPWRALVRPKSIAVRFEEMSSTTNPAHHYSLAFRARLGRSARRVVDLIGRARARTNVAPINFVPRTLLKDARILELSADDGDDLAALLAAGYPSVVGWARTAANAAATRKRHPELRDATIHVGELAAVLNNFDDDHFALAIARSTSPSPLSDLNTVQDLVRVTSSVLLVGPADHIGEVPVGAALIGAGMTSYADRRVSGSTLGRGPVRVQEFRRMEQQSTLHEFWRQPEPEGNQPALYIQRTGRSRALAAIIADVPTSARVLEIGCNVGRNLAYLHDRGYHNLVGIEINPNAIAMLRQTFPQLGATTIHEGSAGEHMATFVDDEFDLIFTMAVIEHLHPDEAATVFDDMVRVGKEIVAIEPEGRVSHRQFPHDVPAIFQERGMELVSAQPMSGFLSTAIDPTIHAYVAWRFHRPGATSVVATAPAPIDRTDVVNRSKAAADIVSESTTALRAEIEPLIVELERSEPPFRPTRFWAPAVVRILEEFDNKGITRFKSWTSAQQFFYPRYGQSLTMADLEKIGTFAAEINPAPPTGWITSRLSGSIDANRDLDIALAMIDRSVVDINFLAHGESEVGAPPQQYRLAGTDGPTYGRPYLNYAKILAALSRVIGAPPRRVLELGGGFGVFGELLHQYRPDTVYVDVDLPPLTSIAGWYFRQVIAGKPTFGPNERLPGPADALWETGFVASMPSWRLLEVAHADFDLFVNCFSFQEMEPETVDGYADLVATIGPDYVATQNSRTGKPIATDDQTVGVQRQTTSDMIVAAFERRGYSVVHRFGRPVSPPQAELVILERG
jgi:putative sugar O-methyltransferase